jgi:hypothetical protein
MKHGLPFIILVFLVVPFAFSIVMPAGEEPPSERTVRRETSGAPPEPPPLVASVPQSAKTIDVDELVAYCDQLPAHDQPSNGCACLFTADEFITYQNGIENQKEYDIWYEKLTQANDTILSQGTAEDLESTRNFCARYYGKPEKVRVMPSTSSRDLASMKPVLKTLAEEKAFASAQMELHKRTGGASDLYCRAYFEMASHAYNKLAHPLAGQGIERSYAILSNSSVCSGRIR